MPKTPDTPLETDAGRIGGSCVLHASCVALEHNAVLILGPSGSGKSALALQLMALGALLVSDDKTHVQVTESGLLATAPSSIQGLIEARGVGVLAAMVCPAARVQLVIDLAVEEHERLPQKRDYYLLGHSLPLLHNVSAAYFPAAILQYLKGGRYA